MSAPRIDTWYTSRYGDTKVAPLPCAFCGARWKDGFCMGETPDRRRDEGISFACERCGCHGPMRATLDAAAKAWNRRKP